MDLQAELTAVRDEALAALATIEDEEQLESLRVSYLGRNGKMKALSKEFGAQPPEMKRQLGQLLGSVNEALRKVLPPPLNSWLGPKMKRPSI